MSSTSMSITTRDARAGGLVPEIYGVAHAVSSTELHCYLHFTLNMLIVGSIRYVNYMQCLHQLYIMNYSCSIATVRLIRDPLRKLGSLSMMMHRLLRFFRKEGRYVVDGQDLVYWCSRQHLLFTCFPFLAMPTCRYQNMKFGIVIGAPDSFVFQQM